MPPKPSAKGAKKAAKSQKVGSCVLVAIAALDLPSDNIATHMFPPCVELHT